MLILVLVPVLLLLSSVIMSLAWLGHLRFRHWNLRMALVASWLLVLPEYCLNVFATRLGHQVYTGAQMASLNLCSGVLCVALVSRYVLKERLTPRQKSGFLLMAVAIGLILS
ncbi:MAG: DMT family protein [Planctomycetota bacterium]|jgi:uncharacterized protein (DUF486 family)